MNGIDRPVPFAAFASRLTLAWLLFGCALGVLCAGGLLFPSFGAPALAGYGRLIATHLDVQLYGWGFAPLLALVAARFFPDAEDGLRRATLALWSAALAAGAIHWLRGGAAGKVFLDWRGFSLAALIAALLVIWWLAARSAWRRRAQPGRFVRAALLAGLAFSGVGFVRACDPLFLPPVNPTSGGATGHNLLASTLGFAALVALIPPLLFPKTRPGGVRVVGLWATLAIGALTHLAMRHGDVSNREIHQSVGLAFTILPGAALGFFMARYPWRSRTAFGWFVFWWLFTAADGLVIFLPGVLETAKFSNALVAHAHWAMAGMLTALNLLILENLPGARVRFGAISQSVWNGANLLTGVALSLHAAREGDGVLWGAHDGETDFAYGVRFLCGAAMAGVAALWLLKSFDHDPSDLFRRRRELWPVWLLASFGLCDVATGLFLSSMPNGTLAWMLLPDAATSPPGLAGLVGVFVGAIGISYLVQARLHAGIVSGKSGQSTAVERGAFLALYVFSGAARVAVAAYGFASVAEGRMNPWWLTVPVADAAIALAQWTLRRRLIPSPPHV